MERSSYSLLNRAIVFIIISFALNLSMDSAKNAQVAAERYNKIKNANDDKIVSTLGRNVATAQGLQYCGVLSAMKSTKKKPIKYTLFLLIKYKNFPWRYVASTIIRTKNDLDTNPTISAFRISHDPYLKNELQVCS